MHPNPKAWERREVPTWKQVPSGLTLGQAVEWGRRNGVPEDAKFSATVHLSFTRMETEEEHAARVAAWEAAERRHREFIIERYAEMQEEER